MDLTRTTPVNAILLESGEFSSEIDNKVTTMLYMANQILKITSIGERILNKASLKKFNQLMEENDFLSYTAPIQEPLKSIPNNITIESSFENISKKNTNDT